MEEKRGPVPTRPLDARDRRVQDEPASRRDGALALVAAVLLPLVLLVLVLAGCAAPAGYQLHGTFTREPRPDWDAFYDLVAEYTDEGAAIMESFPEQFIVTGMTLPGCEAFRAEVLALPYVDSAGECVRPPPTDDGDEPVASG